MSKGDRVEVDLQIAPDLLERMSRPGPRYTSYPTAVAFREDFGPDDYAAALGELGRSGRPLSLYVHLPFCRTLCHYCACNVVITKKPGVAADYLEVLGGELALVGQALGVRPTVAQLHLGGGTPTYLTTDELRRLHALLLERFAIAPDAEQAVEVDPRVTTREQLEVLAELGWNRASFGVQDFDPEVQQAVNRLQSVEQTEALVRAARELGYRGINVDLIYGLPFQREASFARTLEEVLRIRPDRIALYSYAHVPWLRVAQTRFDKRDYPLPGAAEKFALFRLAVQAFQGAGYVHLGMDHFALPEDELARAFQEGRLHRNFQGYTVKRAEDLLALGVSAISDLAGVYAQNAKDLEDYAAAIRAGRLATVRGFRLGPDDLRRRRAIVALMTGAPLPEGFAQEFAAELEALAPLEQEGLVRRSPGGLEVTPVGRFFIRNVAMAFDRYLPPPRADQPTFSRTV